MNKGLTIPHEVAVQITLASLKDHRNYLQSELDAHFEKGTYVHPEDITNNRELIYCLDKLILYYGG